MHIKDQHHSFKKQKQKTNRCKTRDHWRSLEGISVESIMDMKNTKKWLEEKYNKRLKTLSSENKK
jgi:hypothetical protein